MATLAQGSEGKLPHLSTVTRLSAQVHFISRVNTNLSPLSKPALEVGLQSSPMSCTTVGSSNPMHICGEENDLIN